MATQLADGIWWFELRGVNAYLVEDDVLTLIDAGTPFDAQTIEEEIKETGHAVADVERVLLTHYDFDHAGALSRLPDLNAVVRVGAADEALLTGERRPAWRNHKGALQCMSQLFVHTPELTIAAIEDGEEVGTFTAYHTPGHTPGHTAYVSEECSAAFLGDLVFEDDAALSPSSWFVSYDTEEVEESIRSLADRAPDFEVLGMGHGIPFCRGGDERLADLAAALR
ncbi:MAG TPA: MBL fold metallo-hydrolase [Halococcus sp.]|nr:MBL fold metallo-hydrolase [Halococcus sp.]